jgi:hypothetical protein
VSPPLLAPNLVVPITENNPESMRNPVRDGQRISREEANR